MAGRRYEVLFRPENESDLKPLGRGDRNRLFGAIEERLTVDPESYGKPLRGPLARLRRIRVGDFRIAYQVREKGIVIWAVRHRKDIYSELERRFSRRENSH